MVGAQLSALGYPVLDPRGAQENLDKRTEPRFVCRGKVLLNLRSGGAELKGELIDMSANGFRVAFTHPAPATGTEVEFNHQFFHGRARIMWTLEEEHRFEAGCVVLRD
jgi:hypothetical protein